ncbi:MAG TPA: biotin/lipoyl-containing protein [Anaerolineales bacterium]|nr:biotin/lipoyl-containing protein [Anaerolineales bacterium]
MKLTFDHDSKSFPIDLTPSGKFYRVTMGDKSFDVEILQAKEGKLELLIDGKRVTAYISYDNANRWVTVNGQTILLTKSSGARKTGGGHHAAGDLTAPMPGQVRAVNVSEGDAVTKGQTLMLLEAMKMEIRIQSPQNGIVKKLFVNQGQTVEREQMLIAVESQMSSV